MEKKKTRKKLAHPPASDAKERSLLLSDQRIRDPIHNLIKFSKDSTDDAVLWRLIQTSEFQRLRRIRQLGFSELIYPGATHSRLSHVIGAMQMARRMLDVFERNKSITDTTTDHLHWRRATLCSALLHDLGHGPFSHVFEEISKKVGIAVRHETWTKKIITETQVGTVLKESSPELLRDVLSFFEKEPASNPYTQIVSSQLDCDRLDFLVRDRYYTGVQYSTIDLEWLFDSLSIRKLPLDPHNDAKGYSFVVSAKGLGVVASYLYAYTEMYLRVYLHKTTRAAQFMLEDVLAPLILDKKLLNTMAEGDPFRTYFSQSLTPSVDSYLQLDDTTIWATVAWASRQKHPEISRTAKRLIARDLYKCFEPPKRPDMTAPEMLANTLEGELRANKIPYHRDRPSQKAYKQFDPGDDSFLKNILVDSPVDREPKSIWELYPPVRTMATPSPVRFYLHTEADRTKVKQIWESIRNQ